MLRWHKGEREHALKILDRLQKGYGRFLATPEHRGLYQQSQSARGMLLTELSRYREAKPLLEESLSFDSGTIERERVLRDLGLCYLGLGDRERARGMFEECLGERSEGVYATMAHYYLGTILFESAAFAKAQLEFEASLPGAEQASIPTRHIYAYLARTARHLGMKAEAEQYDELAKG
jgi:tetratricopeptide (TPR) repeat protein